MTAAQTVCVVDDEDAVRRSLALMLRLAGYKVKPFESGVRFLEQADEAAGCCILLDVRMPGKDGLEVQGELQRRGIHSASIVMTGHGELSVAVEALRSGAVDFLEKPFEKSRLLASMERAWLKLRDPEGYRAMACKAADSLAALTQQERAVLDSFSGGLSNRSVAAALGLSLRDVELCRASIVARLGGGLSDAVRLAFLARSCA